MKTCPYCSSTAFDDMPICYGCLQPFHGEPDPQIIRLLSQYDDNELSIEEPSEMGRAAIDASAGAAGNRAGDSAYPSTGNPAGGPAGDTAGNTADSPASARFHVTVPDLFGYDIYLDKQEGAVLTVGCARDNNIVLPHSESRRHLLNLRYAQGRVWAEDKGSTQQALIEGIPLTGARQLTQGTVLKVGEAHIELIHT